MSAAAAGYLESRRRETRSTMGFAVPVLLGLAAVFTAAVIWLGRRMRSFSAALLIGFGVLTGIWVLGEVLRDAHWKNMDGFLDCHPSCEFWWDGVSRLFFFGPQLIAVVLIVAVP